MHDAYFKATKLGHKAYHMALQRGENPYLPVLVEKVPQLDSYQHISIGISAIPIAQILGTVRRGRSYAFACNFMPLLGQYSEFSIKWGCLYDSIVKDGMRDPITVVEYMGWYYLIEGNKRASVMRYLEALYIDANVIRYYPPKSEDPKVRAYYESLEFERDARFGEIRMSEPGSYARLADICGYQIGEPWSETDIIDLRSVYHYFLAAYLAEMPQEDFAGAGNAFLTYMKAYGFEKARHKTSDEVREEVRLMRSEIERKEDGGSVRLMLERRDSSPTLLSGLFGPSKIKAAFLYTRPPEESGWNYWHELGRVNVQDALGEKVETKAFLIPSRTAFEEEIDRLISDNYRMIFATSPVMLNSCIRPTLNHPEVKLLCCSQLCSYHHVPSYYLRLYEAKFLMGMVAGSMAENDRIGYIADYPIYGAPSAVNAFAIGARMVNPRARVFLKWSTEMGFQTDDPFAGEDIHVISNRDINAPDYASQAYGLYGLKDGKIQNYAMPILNWGCFYQNAIENLLNGVYQESGPDNSALNYWWGLSSGALDVVLSTKTDPYLQRLIESLKETIQADLFTPFQGEIRDTQGELRCERQQTLTPAQILCMDYLVDNIVGTIPEVEQLQENARPIVRLQGLRGELKPDPQSIQWVQTTD